MFNDIIFIEGNDIVKKNNGFCVASFVLGIISIFAHKNKNK